MVQLKVRALQMLKYRLSLVLEHLELGYPLNRIKELKKQVLIIFSLVTGAYSNILNI